MQNVDCCRPLFSFDVAGGDDAGLLLGFVVLGFCNSVVLLVWSGGRGVVEALKGGANLDCSREMILSILDDIVKYKRGRNVRLSIKV